MALRIVEFFGFSPADRSQEAVQARGQFWCPFLDARCTKTLSDGAISGVCTVMQKSSGPVICCPNRLYADHYRVLKNVAETAFGPGVRLVRGDTVKGMAHDGRNVAVFGKGWGGELQLPRIDGRGGYFVDWILALIGQDGNLQEFVAAEVQSIDTTGNYRQEREAYLSGQTHAPFSKAGLNWENVSKRILPQIIYKGHVLRREARCTKGLFFICPQPVYERLKERLGNDLLHYPTLQPGALTFQWYDLGVGEPEGQRRSLAFQGSYTTTVDQVAMAFTGPRNLPPEKVYEQAIRAELWD